MKGIQAEQRMLRPFSSETVVRQSEQTPATVFTFLTYTLQHTGHSTTSVDKTVSAFETVFKISQVLEYCHKLS